MTTPTSVPDDLVELPPRTAPSRGRALALRIALAVLLVVGVTAAALSPAQRTVADLLGALDRGEVAAVTIERPPGEVSGTFRVLWTGAGRDGTALYRAGTVDGAGVAGLVDQGRTILDAAAASPGDVQVRQVAFLATTPVWLDGVPLTGVALATAAVLLCLLLRLAFGPEPVLATRWAWFWLVAAAWPVWLVHVLLEPAPLWARRSAEAPVRRLTGGWALLIGIVLGPFLLRAVTGA